MALTKAQRKALVDEGIGKAELAKLETILAGDQDQDAGDNGSKAGKGSRRVVVYEGEDAESFMRSMFKGGGDDDDDEDDDEDQDEDEDQDQDEDEDDKPKARTRWFR